jgi:type IV fimbrial biogenesis protein FimT
MVPAAFDPLAANAPMNRPSRPSRRTHGFSLVEMMVVIAIAAILSGLAAPSFVRMINANRIQSAASSLQGDMMYARTEAVKRGMWVSICPSANQSTCDTGTNAWQNGWIVFYDAVGNGVFDASADTLLKVRPKVSGGNTIVASPAPSQNAIIFNREGFTTNLGTAQVAFQLHTSSNDAKATRCVLVTFGGSLSTVEKGSSCS